MLNRCDPSIVRGLQQLQDVGAIEPVDRWQAQLTAAEAQASHQLIAAITASLGSLRAQGHTALPLQQIEAQTIWPQLTDALELRAIASEQQLLTSDVVGTPVDSNFPLIIDQGFIAIHRLWHYESDVAQRLLALASRDGHQSDKTLVLSQSLDPAQQQAVQAALSNHLTLITGGPGTGKTTVAAGIIRALLEQGTVPAHRIGVAAPTGKATARLQQMLNGIEIQAELPSTQTIHRMLGLSRGREPKYGPKRPLPLDVLLLDEASMVDLELMYLLLRALREDARLIVLGDQHQLTAVGVGSVLAQLADGDHPVAEQTAVLKTNYRFGDQAGLTQLARSVVEGDAGQALALLSAGSQHLDWRNEQYTTAQSGWLNDAVPDDFIALPADPLDALQTAGKFRILCAHRRGPGGTNAINQMIRKQLRAPSMGRFAGELVLVTSNDYQLHIFNGDQAILKVNAENQLEAWFAKTGHSGQVESSKHGLHRVAARRLQRAESAWAMTIHKSQGSEFDQVVLILADENSPLANRELLYTGITRARSKLTVVGTEAAIRQAVTTPSQRFSALSAMLNNGKNPD